MQINEFVKRARAVKIHAHIIGHLKKEMPSMIGKAKTQQRLIDNLQDEFGKVYYPLSVYMDMIFFIIISFETYTRVKSTGKIATCEGAKKERE